jgi:hypothetical protein
MNFFRFNFARPTLILSGVLLAALGFGDAKIVSHLKANVMNKPTERDVTTYLKGDWMRTESTDTATLYNIATKNTIILDIAHKTYYEVNGDAAQPDTKGMKVDATATVTPTEEKSKIVGFDCSKYLADINISMSPQGGNFTAKTAMTMEFWTTTQLKTAVTPEHMLYMVTQMFRGAMSIQGMDKFKKEMEKVQGLPLNSKMGLTIEGLPGMTPPKIEIEQVVQSITEETLPDSLFQTPADFKKGERGKRPRNGGGA